MSTNRTAESQSTSPVSMRKLGITLDSQICQLLGLEINQIPLNKYSIYSGSDFNRGSEVVSGIAGKRTMEPLVQRNDQHLEARRAQLGFSQLAIMFNNVPTRLRFPETLKLFSIAIPLCGHLLERRGDEEIIVEPTQGHFSKVGDMPDLVRGENSVILVAQLSGEHYQRLFGFSSDILVNAKDGGLPKLLDLLDPKYRIFLSILGTLCKTLDEEQNSHPRQDVVIRCLEKALWNQFDDLVPPFEAGSPKNQDHTLLPKHLRKTVDYIHANADCEMGMPILESVSGVSSRSLQAGFKDWLGISPMHYVKKIRLAKVRSDLLIADPESTVIGDVAAHWGLFHLSNFAKDFRNEFGELPSETIQKSRF